MTLTRKLASLGTMFVEMILIMLAGFIYATSPLLATFGLAGVFFMSLDIYFAHGAGALGVLLAISAALLVSAVANTAVILLFKRVNAITDKPAIHICSQPS